MSEVAGIKIVEVALNPTTCATCGVLFGLSSGHEIRLRSSGAGFFCPNGHRLVFNKGRSAEQVALDLLEKERAEARRQRETDAAEQMALLEQLETERRSKAAVQGHLGRVNRRACAGVCLHCKRTFSNVARHMETNHLKAAR